MKTTLITTAIVSLILVQSCGSSKETSSSPQKPEEKYYSRILTPVIDGKMNEWGDTLLYDNSTKCIYSIANDASALYICIKATERLQQMKIIQGGMQIWIDGKVKKNKSIGIKFPIGGGTMQMSSSARNKEPDTREIRQQARSQMLTMELTGFKDGLNGAQSIYSNAQVKPVIEWDNKDNLVYELAIPFTAFDETFAANLNNISIGIFINGLKIPEGMGGGMPAGGPPGGMPSGGGPPGGMRPAGGSGGMPDQTQMENMSKENFFWTKYSITKK
jgi:hypothetical protein